MTIINAEIPPDNRTEAANKWGHDKTRPRFHLALVPGKSRPKQIDKLAAAARSYYSNPFILPTLANLSEKTNKDGKPRCNRSDAREAESLIMCAIFNATEFASMRAGAPQPDGSFKHISCRRLARNCQMLLDPTDEEIEQLRTPRPTARFWRAFARLKAAGMFTTSRQYEKIGIDTKGKAIYRARPAIKALNIHFVLSLNVLDSERLKSFRDYCSKALKKRKKQHAKTFHDNTDAIRARQILASDQKRKGINTHPPVRSKDTGPADLLAEYRHKKVMLQSSLIKQGKTRTQIPVLVRNKLGTEAEYIARHTN